MEAFSPIIPKTIFIIGKRKNEAKKFHKILSRGLKSLGKPSNCPASKSDCSIGRCPVVQAMPSAKCSLLGVSIT